MLKKKTGGKRVNCFLYIVHRAPEKMSKMFAKKVSKEGAKGQKNLRTRINRAFEGHQGSI